MLFFIYPVRSQKASSRFFLSVLSAVEVDQSFQVQLIQTKISRYVTRGCHWQNTLQTYISFSSCFIDPVQGVQGGRRANIPGN